MCLTGLQKPNKATDLYSHAENSAVSLTQQNLDTVLFLPKASTDTLQLDFLVVHSSVGYSCYEAQHIQAAHCC